MSRIDKIPVSIVLPHCDILIKPASQEFNLVSKSQSQNETEINVELLHETAPKKKISTKNISPFHKLEDDQVQKKSYIINLEKKTVGKGVIKTDSLMLKFEKSWKDFQKYLGNEKIQPTSRDYLQYFHHLQYTEGKGGPSLWATFHRLKQVHQNIFKEDIRSKPELIQLAESFKNLETNRESAELNRLNLDEIKDFLTNPNLANDKYWLSRRALVIIAHFTKLKCCDMKKLQLQNVSIHQNQVVFILGKYEIPNKKIVSEMEDTYASLFTQYYESVIRDSKAAPSTGFLFRHYFKKSGIYTKTPLGINAMYLVRKEISQTRIH